MNKYIRIYQRLLKLHFSSLVIYRTNFINSVIGSLIWGIFSVISVIILTSHTRVLFGWTQDEFILLTGVYGLFIGIFHFAFSSNFARLPMYVRMGSLDSVLLKPVDSQFYVSMSWVNFASIVRFLIGFFVVWYLAMKMHIVLTPAIFLLFILFLSIGIIILYSIWFMVTTITIWYPELSNLVEFLFNFSNVGRYPREMFVHANRFIFFFLLPLTFIAVTPTRALVSKLTAYDVGGSIFFASLLFFISRMFWKYALRFYTSASN